MKFTQKLHSICGVILLLTACSPIRNSQYSQANSLVAEVDECLTNTPYADSIIISGTASFYKRGINLVVDTGQLKNMNLGNPLATPLPIRFAEIAVYNSSNKLVQCGLTDTNGNLKALDGTSDLKIPKAAAQYLIRVMARTNVNLTPPASSPAKPSFNLHVAIKQDIYTNEIHFISRAVYSNGVDNLNNIDLIAYARQSDSIGIEGGAFNILNSITTAYDYIRNNTGSVDTTCLNEKLNVFWKAGFNPFQYTTPGEDPSYISNGSYYNKDEEHLYITGGRLGDVSIDVTNHFDDFVIIHELAHHIENKCGQLLSPGGNHYILSRIDPRLAWAEGWANYFAAQVMYDSNSIANINPEIGPKLVSAGLSTNWTYFFGSKGLTDSVQNIDNGTGFMFDLKKSGNNPDAWQFGLYQGSLFDKVEPSRYPGEGHFREGAITRGLFKLTNNCGGSCLPVTTTPIAFEKVWKSMDKITGVGQSDYIFKSSHNVLEKIKSFVGAGTWAADYKTFNQATTSEALNLFSDLSFTSAGINRWIPYGSKIQTQAGGGCAIGQLYIEPRSDDPVLTATNSDQRYSNHFYTIDFSVLTGLDEINVTFAKQNMSGTTTEFDILLFQENYFFNSDYVCTTPESCTNQRTNSNDVLRSDRRSGFVPTKTIRNLQALDPTKRYLLNIRAYTANKTLADVTSYSYVMTNQAGLTLCP